jgi:DNA polymerase
MARGKAKRRFQAHRHIGSSAFRPASSSRLSPLKLRTLQNVIAACTICPSLKPWRRFEPKAYGTPFTGFLLVGEAPGYASWKKRRRFTGPAGLLVRRALAQTAHPRYRDLEDLFYMTDAIKCHPSPPENQASNRAPRRAEIEACSQYLVREIQVLAPSVIVTFGRAAAEGVARALDPTVGSRSSRPRVLRFPHPSPRNQRTILQQYRSMRAFEQALTDAFCDLIAELEAPRNVKREA